MLWLNQFSHWQLALLLVFVFVGVSVGLTWQLSRKAIAARPVMDRIFQLVMTFKPSTMGEMAVQSEVLSTLNAIALTHRQREGAASQRVMPVMWGVVCVAAFVVMALMLLTTTGYARMDYLLAGGYGTIIGLAIFLIISLDHPFVGESNVSPGAFLEVLGLMDHLDAIASGAALAPTPSH